MPQRAITYRIRNWEKNFENHDSRKLRSLTWLPVPNKHDGRGYRRVAALPNSVQVFCGWALMLQVASKMPTRGVLADDDGALTAFDLSDKTGYPASIFEAAFEALVDPGIRWLEAETDGESGESPGISRNLPPQGKGREGHGMEEERQKSSAVALPPPAPILTDTQWLGILKGDPAYQGIDVDREYAKMVRWCETNKKRHSRRRFINWLNRIERPMEIHGNTRDYTKF